MKARKHAMRTRRLKGYFTPRLHRTLTLPSGKMILFAINRRGCTSKWSDTDDAMLREIVEALAWAPTRTEPTTPAETTNAETTL